MVTVQKTGDAAYLLSVDEGSIDRAFSSYSEGSISPVGDPATHNFVATITVEINDGFAASARGLCSSKLNLEADLGSPANELSVLRGLMKAPLPVSSSYGRGNVPEMSEEQLDNIESNLESINREKTVSFTANISNGAKMALAFFPDTMGFHIELVDMSQGMDLYHEHAFVLTSFFTIDTLPDDGLSSGPGGASFPAEINDARVFIESTEVDVGFAETLTTELIRIGHAETRNNLVDGYYQLLNEMFWREEQVVAERIPRRPYVSHLYGVGLSGKAIVVIELHGLTTRKSAFTSSLDFKGEASVKFIYGDIRYPADPMLTASKPKFDIISDSEEWTLHGPTSIKYVGGDGSDDTPETIFSWEGRTSASPKILSQIAAGLEDY